MAAVTALDRFAVVEAIDRVVLLEETSGRIWVPLADAPLRQVIIAGTDGKAVATALALVRAQRAPYAPSQVTSVWLPGGQPGLRVDFAAPGPLGLLTGTASG